MLVAFTLLFFLAALGGLLGLIRPRLVGAKTRPSALLRSGAVAIAAFIGIAATAPAPEGTQAAAPQPPPVTPAASEAPRPAAPVAQAPAAPRPAPAPPPKPAGPPIPAAQARLIALVDEYAALYRNAPNDMAKGAMRPARAQAICQSLRTEVRDWVGTVATLDSTAEGLGVLAVTIAPNVTLRTWNLEFADIQDRTLIRPGTPLHAAVVQLRRRQQVIVSGTLFRDDSDCFKEVSVTVHGAMTDPDFLFRFTSVRPAE